MRTTDLLNVPYTEAELRLMEVYDALKALAVSDELAPCAVGNVRVALAALAVAVTDLALEYEHLAGHGC